MNNQNKKNGHFRIYVFATVAVTLFLVGLVFLRTPIDGFVAESIIEVDSVALDQTSDKVLSASKLQSAITAEPVLASVFPNSKRDHILEKVDVIWVSRVNVQDGIGQRFRISYMGETRSNAIESTQALAQKAVAHIEAQNQTSAKPKFDSGQLTQLEDSINREAHARRTLDQSVATNFQDLVKKIESIETVVELPDLPSDVETNTPTERPTVRNPEWVRLNAEVDQLSQRSRELLTRFTPDHPQVKELALQINQARLALATTPEMLGEESGTAPKLSDDSEPASHHGPTSEDQLEEVKAAVVGAADHYRQLQSDYQLNRRTSGSIVDELKNVNVHIQAPEAQVAAVIQPARITRREGGLPSRLPILAIAILSMAVGVAAALLAGGEMKPVFRDKKQVEAGLAIPVAATIPVAEAQTNPNAGFKMGHAVHWLTKSCEVILAVIVIALLFFALADSPTFDGFASDPFGTISETVARAQKFQI